MIPEHVKQAFHLEGQTEVLPGGSRPVYRVGQVVVKQIYAGSLETEHSLTLAPWLAGEFAAIDERDFRLTRPIKAHDGRWMLADGWMAWSFLDGRSMRGTDIPQVMTSIRALHSALRHIPKHPLLDRNTTAWGFAHRSCWKNQPLHVHPVLTDLVDALYAKYTPLPDLPCQLIHGDLNIENILVTPGKPAGFLDFTPFWAPVDFAIAMFANWIGPRRGDSSVLHSFMDIPHFPQLLLRAAVRMLLIVSALAGVEEWENAPEKQAAECVLELSC